MCIKRQCFRSCCSFRVHFDSHFCVFHVFPRQSFPSGGQPNTTGHKCPKENYDFFLSSVVFPGRLLWMWLHPGSWVVCGAECDPDKDLCSERIWATTAGAWIFLSKCQKAGDWQHMIWNVKEQKRPLSLTRTAAAFSDQYTERDSYFLRVETFPFPPTDVSLERELTHPSAPLWFFSNKKRGCSLALYQNMRRHEQFYLCSTFHSHAE